MTDFEVRQKFLGNASVCYAEPVAEQLFDRLMALEDCPDMRGITAFMRETTTH